jgi:hypothetical protein
MEPKQTEVRKLIDLIFVGASILFNISVSAIYIATKLENRVLQQQVGAFVLVLILPFTVALLGYVKEGAGKQIITSLCIILFYLFLELLLDYILRIPFRDILVLHILYIVVFYAASFSMIGVSFGINRKLGYVVTITFLILIGCLIYLYMG